MVKNNYKDKNICCVKIWFMGRHIYSYSLENFPRVSSSYLVNKMIAGSVLLTKW